MRQKNRFQKAVSVILLLLLLGSFTACRDGSRKAEDTGKTGTSAAVGANKDEKPVPLTALYSYTQAPAENNSVLAELNKRMNMDLKVTTVAGSDYENKLNILIASDALPDIFSVTSVNLQKYVDNGIIVALDELLKQYGKNILENKADVLKYSVVNGKTWRVPFASYAYPNVLAIRTDWLNNVGISKVPETLDEFYDAMKAFTKNDPNKNGKDDTIGMGFMLASMSQTMQPAFSAYGISLSNGNYVDGKVVPYLMHPKFMEVVKYYRKMYQEGLLEPDFATIPNMQCCEKLWNGTYGAFSYSPVGITNNWLSRYTEDQKPMFAYTYLKGPDGKGGIEVNKGSQLGGSAISSKCKNPEAAVKLLDYMVSAEGDELVYLGVKGKHYEWNSDGTVKYFPPYDKDTTAHRMDGGFVYTYLMSRTNGTEYKTMNKITKDALDLGKNNPLSDAFIVTTPQISKDTGQTLSKIMQEALVSLIVSKGNIDEEYKLYTEKYLKSGGDKWIEQATEIYIKENNIK